MVKFNYIYGFLCCFVLPFILLWKLSKGFSSLYIYALECVLYRVWRAIFWPPDDIHRPVDCHKHPCQECLAQRLINKIDHAKICITVILLTTSHKGLCKALMQAHLRGVQVFIAARPKALTATQLMLKQLWIWMWMWMFGKAVRESPEMGIVHNAIIDGLQQNFLLHPEIFLFFQFRLFLQNRLHVPGVAG